MSRKAPTPCPYTREEAKEIRDRLKLPSPPPTSKRCICEHNCKGQFRDCPSAFTLKGGLFKWAGEYHQEAKVDDITVSIGLGEFIDITQPGDKDREDIILVFGIDRIRALKEVLSQAGKIIIGREGL